ncbi:glycosyl transferase family 1 [Acrocarpospora pleiomorpha]|uniref:Glycosyl transferase family 1 n=1 Tax=Acrocarpospora pleiomorpha TaxID=90975 RepID=A0A5M3X6W6_9ACTN|nr:glycosyltransferase [Acrocarpospora pleiomorpha]GES17437.1 glycosyl transferase family 1 [Acrocarpospora pleiomorpha]
MKVLILAHGTRGDVQPYAALALALQRAGHQAVLAAPAASAALAESHGLAFTPVHDGPNTLIDDPRIRQAIETNYRGLAGKKAALQVMRASKPLMARVFADMVAAAFDTASGTGPYDLVVHGPSIPGHRIAEELGVPAVPALLQPMWVPTDAFPNPMLPIRLPHRFNRATYLPFKLMLRPFGAIADKSLNLPNRRGRHDFLRRPDGGPATVLHGFSRHLLPPGAGYPASVHTTGFWYLPAAPAWTPPTELTRFLEQGPPPVYIGFGSMAGTDPARIGRIVAEAITLARVHAVVVSGWGGIAVDDLLDTLPDQVIALKEAPHDWLFPRMAAIVHHGGSGTTGAALASGRPQVICPFVADQPFWAARAHAAGIAPAPQPQRHLTPHGLAEAIGRAVTDPAMSKRAEQLAAAVSEEAGVTTAVTVLESLTVRRT